MANDNSRINKIRFSDKFIEELKQVNSLKEKKEDIDNDLLVKQKIRIYLGNPVKSFLSSQKTGKFNLNNSKPFQESKICEYCSIPVKDSKFLTHIAKCQKKPNKSDSSNKRPLAK